MIAVRPPLVVVPDDARAHARPFQRIRRGEDVVGLDGPAVFNGHAQPVEGLDPLPVQGGQQPVGEGEIVRVLPVRIRVPVPEHVGNVHEAAPAVPAAGIVQAGKRDARLPEEVKQLVVSAQQRRVAHPVHGLDHAVRATKIARNARHTARSFL